MRRGPIGFYRRKRVHGYLRKDGRLVEAYWRKTWALEFPPLPKGLKLEIAPPRPYKPRIPKELIPPEILKARKLAQLEKRRASWRKLKETLARREWVNVKVFVEHLYNIFDFFEIEDPFYRVDPDADVISTKDGLIWDYPLKTRTLAAIQAQEVAVVRAWVLLYNTNKNLYFVFARCKSILLRPEPTRQSFEAAYSYAQEFYNEVVEDVREKWDYVEVVDLIAWSFWYVMSDQSVEKSPSKFPYHLKYES